MHADSSSSIPPPTVQMASGSKPSPKPKPGAASLAPPPRTNARVSRLSARPLTPPATASAEAPVAAAGLAAAAIAAAAAVDRKHVVSARRSSEPADLSPVLRMMGAEADEQPVVPADSRMAVTMRPVSPVPPAVGGTARASVAALIATSFGHLRTVDQLWTDVVTIAQDDTFESRSASASASAVAAAARAGPTVSVADGRVRSFGPAGATLATDQHSDARRQGQAAHRRGTGSGMQPVHPSQTAATAAVVEAFGSFASPIPAPLLQLIGQYVGSKRTSTSALFFAAARCSLCID
jgi:hypothetical protein